MIDWEDVKPITREFIAWRLNADVARIVDQINGCARQGHEHLVRDHLQVLEGYVAAMDELGLGPNWGAKAAADVRAALDEPQMESQPKQETDT